MRTTPLEIGHWIGHATATYAADGTTTWVDDAACTDQYEAFDAAILSDLPSASADALAVCRYCVVLDDCRRWALDTGQRHGVWGGLMATERTAILRLVNRKAAG